MKAGAFTPATLGAGVVQRAHQDRSMKAGAFTPATPRGVGGEGGELELRSMKAGAFTPATPVRRGELQAPAAGTLNEGGGLHPRNAGLRLTVWGWSGCAQ